MTKLPALLLLLSLLVLSGQSRDIDFIKTRLGGIRDSPEVQSLARFAVQEYNKRENAILELGRVLKVGEQVVAGKMYHLTLEVVDGGANKVFEARVWVKPWIHFMQLQEFKPAMDDFSSSAAHVHATSGY